VTELENVLQCLLGGQYSNPVRIVSFNTVEGWSCDVSADVAEELPNAATRGRPSCAALQPSELRNPSKRQSLGSRQALKWSANSALPDSADDKRHPDRECRC
jgi:hypothetical protein